MKGKLKQKCAILMDNDKFFDKGMRDELFGKFQIMFGKTKEKLLKIIAAL
jgi:uncharacterized protein YjbJ (UPF0337 family)